VLAWERRLREPLRQIRETRFTKGEPVDHEMEKGVKRIAVELLVIAAIGAAMAMLGPFGSYALPVATRTIFWILLSFAGYALIRPTIVVGRWLSSQTGIAPLAGTLIAVTIACLPLTALVALWLERLGQRLPDDGYALLYAQVWGLGLAITLFLGRFFRDEAAPERSGVLSSAEPPPVPASLRRPQLLDRLPPGFGERIRCLEMEDHYVRVHGEHRSDLLLMRLADAIRETAPVPGVQVHRGWWVALDAIAAQEREGRRTVLRLDDGKRVPVAGSRVGAVRALVG
jgi:hypothetical protein